MNVVSKSYIAVPGGTKLVAPPAMMLGGIGSQMMIVILLHVNKWVLRVL